MRSIRLSLLVYFLGLLGLALGTVSLLVYRTAERTLAEKKIATKELIERQFKDMCNQERTRLDDALLADAKALARHAQIHFDPEAGRVFNEGPPGSRRQLGVIAA